MMQGGPKATTGSGPSMARRAAAASMAGSALEWIDFTTYGALSATVFPQLFFPWLAPGVGILAAFATFGVGVFARPLGGLFFGMLGDSLGRKTVLLCTLMVMGLSSFFIGCLPTYASIGILAPTGLVILRFFQGFALGGEATGAQLMAMEHAPSDRRGLFGSLINVGSSVSAACANAMMFTLIAVFGTGAFQQWAWRLPFLLSLSLVLLGVYIRLRITETPTFLHLRETRSQARLPVLEVLRRHPGAVARLLLLWCAPTACFYVINVFSLGYLTKTLGVSSDIAFLCLTAANLFAVVAIIAGGALSDIVGRKPVMVASSLAMLAATLAYFPLLHSKAWYLIFAAMAAFLGALQIQSGVQPALFAESFPTRVRYSGSAAAYTGANLVAAGPAPFVAAWLLARAGGQTWSITAACVAVVVISLIAILCTPETRDVDLNR